MPTYSQVVRRLKEVKQKGFIRTHRTGQTGIGKTIEDLLGIKENNIPGPDAEMYELKSGRKDTKSMLTLFTKSPLPPKANSVLLKRFGYPSAKGNKKKELHFTVNAISFGMLKGKTGLKINVRNGRVELVNKQNEVLCYWNREVLRERFEKKYPTGLVYIKADARGKGADEAFWFNEVWVLKGFDFQNFLRLLKEGVIFVDIRIGQYPDGRPHDHGTGFRVFPDKLELCFSYRKRII